MALKDNDWLDPTKRAADHLNQALDQSAVVEGLTVLDASITEKEKKRAALFESEQAISVPKIETEQNVVTVDVDEARMGAPVLEFASEDRGARLLIITKDSTVLIEGSLAYGRLTDICTHFVEIHILVLNMKEQGEEKPIMRPFENVWIYPTHASVWWMLCYQGYKLAQSQLEFGGGFRADLIVAEDSFESGIVAKFLGSRYKRPFQLHLYEDFFDSVFIETQEHPSLYAWCSDYVLEHASSVRTKTEFQRQAVIRIEGSLEANAELLPTYYSLNAWRDTPPSRDLHTIYPQFKFIILTISSMSKGSHTSQIISGVAVMLKRYPTIGLVIVGNGPLRSLYEKQIIAHGIQGQVEFEPMPTEVISHMKSANAFIHLSDEGSEDEFLLMAAVSKVPLIVNSNGLGGSLFTDGESAIVCAPDDIACVADGVNRYLNENRDRTRLALEAYETVYGRLEQNYEGYLKAYAGSIQRSGTLPR